MKRISDVMWLRETRNLIAYLKARDWMGSLKLASAGDRAYSFDINLQLSDGIAAIVADGYAQVGGADGLIDLGGNQAVTPRQQARVDAYCVIDVTAIDISSTDELYFLKVMGSNDSTFAAPNVITLAAIQLGTGANMVPATQLNSVVGRYEIGFTNEQANVKYQYIKLFVDTAGTSPSITFKAFVAVEPEP